VIRPFKEVWIAESGTAYLHLGEMCYRVKVTETILPLELESHRHTGKGSSRVRTCYCTWHGHEDNHKIRSAVLAWLAGKRMRSEFRPKIIS
jgi:hypothetical protein